MRVLCHLLVVVLGVYTCSADRLAFSQQEIDLPSLLAGVLAVGDESYGLVGLPQQYDLSDVDESPEVLTVWPDSGAIIQTWLAQPLSTLDSWKTVLTPRCPHATAMATPPQGDYPALLSYMASSRFGPSTLTAYARQVDQDLQSSGFSITVLGDGTSISAAEDEVVSAEGGAGQEMQLGAAGLDSSGQPVWTGSSGLGGFGDAIWFGSQQDAELAASAAADAQTESEPLFHSNALYGWEPTPQQGDSDSPQDEQLEWGQACNVILFIALCIGCVVVWVGLMRAWLACCRLEKQVMASKVKAAPNSLGPLLAPLIPESATHNPAFTHMDLPADQPARAIRQIPEYVSIAYIPLDSEAGLRN